MTKDANQAKPRMSNLRFLLLCLLIAFVAFIVMSTTLTVSWNGHPIPLPWN